MDFQFTEEQEAFRKEVREFLEKEVPPEFKRQGPEEGSRYGYDRRFSRKVAEKGWIGLTWPKEYGGQGRSPIDRVILLEEMSRYGAPIAAFDAADRQIGPHIIAFGNDEMKKEFLPKILRGELGCAFGLSEPQAGSDLAAVETTAVEDGDYYIVNGQKVWTSWSQYADYFYLVVRTDPNVPKHRGLSELYVDVDSPGVTIRPVIDMTGAHHLNEVFFDNVRVPGRRLIGQKNRGWYQIVSQLDAERSTIAELLTNYPLFADLVNYTKETRWRGKLLAEDPFVRESLAELHTEFEVGCLLFYREAWLYSKGITPNYEASMGKLYAACLQQHLASAAMQILGMYGQLTANSKWVPLSGRVARLFLRAPSFSLFGGTNEIQKNVIAQRGLGMPRA